MKQYTPLKSDLIHSRQNRAKLRERNALDCKLSTYYALVEHPWEDLTNQGRHPW